MWLPFGIFTAALMISWSWASKVRVVLGTQWCSSRHAFPYSPMIFGPGISKPLTSMIPHILCISSSSNVVTLRYCLMKSTTFTWFTSWTLVVRRCSKCASIWLREVQRAGSCSLSHRQRSGVMHSYIWFTCMNLCTWTLDVLKDLWRSLLLDDNDIITDILNTPIPLVALWTNQTKVTIQLHDLKLTLC